MPTYRLEFHPQAWREWNKLGATVRAQARRKLEAILDEPRIASARMRGERDCYRIKLRASGYRLLYRVEDGTLVVFVVAIGQRDSGKKDAYDVGLDRLARLGRSDD